MLKKNAVWLITGCSKGLGRALARSALQSGYRVVASARDTAALEDLVCEYGDAVAAVSLDVTSQQQAEAAVAAAHERFGSIDVLVDNAGYGYLAAIEEGDESDVRAMFETNVYGTWNMIKAALPGMRKHRAGHIVNISSVGGLTTFPGVGFYHMTKFAVEGLSETLAKEIGPLGLGVTVVEPGAFRTDFRGASMKQSGMRIKDYADTAGKTRDSVLAGHGQQQGDPVRGSRAIIAALESDRPPLHLVIGGDALDLVRAKLEDLRHDLDAWEHLTRSTNYEA
ncbi:short-chain dehydrogenase/reductase [Trinickia dabaoshanensis]|uniref:Short-chain dehydrogenase/reductase n=1 Tax=Trinickia dabaoshanensis TaxID=564714 RepID=A0A2N7VWQ8_9BURK|nr:oxidoreductase [Trinickia dabaoshanensis]PMS21578.1 short-chain dehydrogenase/reductase [Trinickia dabaoshanensis]